jgi:5-methylcytosine-specific restriction endonuclease McrA
MSDRDRKKRRRSRETQAYGEAVDVMSLHVSSEKQKARELRHSSWWKQKLAEGKCYYCGGVFIPDELTMDHKIPLSRGGFSEKINLVTCCKECNNKKKYLLPTEWDEYMNSLKKS